MQLHLNAWGNNMRNKIKIFISGLVISSSAFAIATLGNACGKFSSNLSFSNLSACDGKDDIYVYDKSKTVAISYGDQVLSNMRSCLGLRTISNTTRLEFQSRRPSFSEYGYANEVSGPMFMGIASLAGEVCNDFVEEEAQRTTGYAFDPASLSSTSLSKTEVEDSFSNLAFRCWGRLPTTDELTQVSNGITDNFDSNPKLTAVSICTVVLSSLSGVEM